MLSDLRPEGRWGCVCTCERERGGVTIYWCTRHIFLGGAEKKIWKFSERILKSFILFLELLKKAFWVIL